MEIQVQFLVCMLAGWINREQQSVIEYLQEENKILLEQLGGKPKPFTDSQRKRLAVKAAEIGRKELEKVAKLVTPDTLRRGLRKLIKKSGPLNHRREEGVRLSSPKLKR